MKRYGLILIAALTWASCSQNSHNNDEHHTDQKHAESNIDAPVDPVCKMIKDDTWTEFTVSANDTTWFCSPHCKEMFDKNPEKYKGS